MGCYAVGPFSLVKLECKTETGRLGPCFIRSLGGQTGVLGRENGPAWILECLRTGIHQRWFVGYGSQMEILLLHTAGNNNVA